MTVDQLKQGQYLQGGPWGHFKIQNYINEYFQVIQMAWSLLNLEAHCMFDSMNKKKVTYYSYDDGFLDKYGNMKEPTSERVENNPLYIKAERPKWCKKKFPGRKERTPEFKCLGDGCNKCPFLMFTDVDKIDNEVIDAAFSINNCRSWNDEKMKFDKRVSKKFIEHMLKFKEEK